MKNREAEVKRWLESDGQIFLKEIGIGKGQTVLDFGCGEGHYTIPAAKVVGDEGKVYAVDKDRENLDELIGQAAKCGLKNIATIETKSQLEIPEMNDSFVDAVLLYDVIHLVSDRNKLYKEIYRISKPEGLLSIYPKHYIQDEPGWGLEDMSLEDIIKEIERAKFRFENKFFKRLMHDDYYDRGYILNFRKG